MGMVIVIEIEGGPAVFSRCTHRSATLDHARKSDSASVGDFQATTDGWRAFPEAMLA